LIRTIVFDFGNVIGFFDHSRATTKLAAQGQLTAAAIDVLLFGGSLEDDYEAGRLTTADYLSRVRDQCGLRCSEADLIAAYGDIFWPNPEVCSLIPLLKPRYGLILGSNTTDLHARQFRRQFADVLGHFDDLVLSFEIGVRKPAADFFRHCQQLAGCSAGECLFIDDLEANVAGARACGWQGLVYAPHHDLRRQLLTLGIVIAPSPQSSLSLSNGCGLQLPRAEPAPDSNRDA
jgi:FMN phosphatase YigB (HAD superfamily)